MIQVFPSGPLATNAYVIVCPKTKEAMVIDPAPDSSQLIVDYILKNNLTLKKIVLTHSHWDHFADLFPLLQKMKAPVYVHEEDKQNIIHPGSDGLPMFFLIHGVQPDFILKEGDKINLGEFEFVIIHTPGHSPGSVCLYDQKHEILISGDTLFKGSIGTLSLPTSEPDRMWPSLEKLAALPLETKVYPGHGEKTCIKDERWLKNAKEIFS